MERRVATCLVLALAGCAHPETGEEPSLASLGSGPSAALMGEPGSTSYQYFTAVKQTVGRHWDPQGQLRLNDPRGAAIGKNRYTLLSVTLDAGGKLLDVHVKESSGLYYVDDAALLAFQKSELPTPPAEVIKEGFVKFDFGFLLDFGSRPWRPGKVPDAGIPQRLAGDAGEKRG
jgi:TonB family protein